MSKAFSDKPGTHAAVVTPSDSTIIVARALYVGTGGDISVTTVEDETVTFTGVLSGSILPLEIKRVNSTSTTATNIVRMW